MELAKSVRKACGKNLSDIQVFDVYEGAGIDVGKKSIAYSLVFSSQEKTLTDEEINPLLDKITQQTAKEFGASLR